MSLLSSAAVIHSIRITAALSIIDENCIHVNTQLPYALLVAAVSFVAYVAAPFVGTAWVALPLAVALMLATLFFLKLVLKGPADGAADAISHKVRQIEGK